MRRDRSSVKKADRLPAEGGQPKSSAQVLFRVQVKGQGGSQQEHNKKRNTTRESEGASAAMSTRLKTQRHLL